jgi:acetyl esterase/lipase
LRLVPPPSFRFILTSFAAAIAVSFAGAQPRIPDLTATFARVDTIDLKIDLYLPPPRYDFSGAESVLVAGASQRPVILWMHGGGWRGGSRGEDSPAYTFVDSGFVVASIDYRFSQQATWPAQLHDAKAAVRWLRAHAVDLRLDTARVVAWGNSAGGHIAALLGVTSPADSLEGRVGADTGTSSRVRAVVDFYGPSNFLEYIPRRWTSWSSVGQLLGCGVSKCLERARLASPVTYASPGDPPFFITHGLADSTVPFSQSVALDSALQAAGVHVEFAPVSGADHGGAAFEAQTMSSRVSLFLRRIFAGK